jgi:methyltransferase
MDPKRRRVSREGGRAAPAEGQKPQKQQQGEETRRRKPKKPKDKKGRAFTVTVAIPGSAAENLQTDELRSRLAGQIGRLLAVFSVDEVCVFEETDDACFAARGGDGGDSSFGAQEERAWGPGRAYSSASASAGAGDGNGEGNDATASTLASSSSSSGDAAAGPRRGFRGTTFLARLLQYLETPQYLRKNLFPMHRDLKFAGTLQPLDTPHHMRQNEWVPYREGVVQLPRDQYERFRASGGHTGDGGEAGSGTGDGGTGGTGGDGGDGGTTKKSDLVHVGFYEPVKVDRALALDTRVTVALGDRPPAGDREWAQGFRIASPAEPREVKGLYWGYSVRVASSLRNVFAECPFEDGYDLTIGTSERGRDVADVALHTARKFASSSSSSSASGDAADDSVALPAFRHVLIVFGGPPGIEACVAGDSELAAHGVKPEQADTLFDRWLNILPNQGSRTIRMEEALAIGLTALRPALLQAALKH